MVMTSCRTWRLRVFFIPFHFAALCSGRNGRKRAAVRLKKRPPQQEARRNKRQPTTQTIVSDSRAATHLVQNGVLRPSSTIVLASATRSCIAALPSA